MRKSKLQILREKELAIVEGLLTEKGYRDFLAKFVTCSKAYFDNGGRFNWRDFEMKKDSL